MNARRLMLVFALASLGLCACGGDGSNGNGDEIPEGQSLVVITVNLAEGLPEIRQIWVAAHNGMLGDVDLNYPMTPGGPITSGATLGILVPDTTGLLDLVLRGLNAPLASGGMPVARGSGQAMIMQGSQRVYRTFLLEACGTSGTSGC